MDVKPIYAQEEKIKDIELLRRQKLNAASMGELPINILMKAKAKPQHFISQDSSHYKTIMETHSICNLTPDSKPLLPKKQ